MATRAENVAPDEHRSTKNKKKQTQMALQALNDKIKCPKCGSDALYKYGRTPEGQQKYQCIICDRQFVENSSRTYIRERPNCPKCGAAMHVYMRTENLIRFRCSNYPRCRTFVKTNKEV